MDNLCVALFFIQNDVTALYILTDIDSFVGKKTYGGSECMD